MSFYDFSTLLVLWLAAFLLTLCSLCYCYKLLRSFKSRCFPTSNDQADDQQLYQIILDTPTAEAHLWMDDFTKMESGSVEVTLKLLNENILQIFLIKSNTSLTSNFYYQISDTLNLTWIDLLAVKYIYQATSTVYRLQPSIRSSLWFKFSQSEINPLMEALLNQHFSVVTNADLIDIIGRSCLAMYIRSCTILNKPTGRYYLNNMVTAGSASDPFGTRERQLLQIARQIRKSFQLNIDAIREALLCETQRWIISESLLTCNEDVLVFGQALVKYTGAVQYLPRYSWEMAFEIL